MMPALALVAALPPTLASAQTIQPQDILRGSEAPASGTSAQGRRVPLQARQVQPQAQPQSAQRPVLAQPVDPAPQVTFAAEAQLPPGVVAWPRERAQALLDSMPLLAAEGLDPADYGLDRLRTALSVGDEAVVAQVASAIFTAVVEDLRDGHTPRASRKEWYSDETDSVALSTQLLLRRAADGESLPAIYQSLVPTHPGYAALRAGLAVETDPQARARIRANMDRWRWLPRDLGDTYIIVNVPEYEVRLMMNGQLARSYRAIVGQPGRNATPQFSDVVEGVVFNPTWTVPQSIVVGEGLGQRVLSNPAWAKARGYSATRGADGYVSVVQAPGPGNSLGKMKLDMPNDYAIFLHDTPAKQLFDQNERALSHGCIRTEDALELAYTMTVLGEGGTIEDAVAAAASGEYTKVALARHVPVYITYFTVNAGKDGGLQTFADLYGRDGPVLAAL